MSTRVATDCETHDDGTKIALEAVATFARSIGHCVRVSFDGALWFVGVDRSIGVGATPIEAAARCLNMAQLTTHLRGVFADENARARDHVVIT